MVQNNQIGIPMKKKIIFLLSSAAVLTTMSFSILSDDGRAGVTASPNETSCNTSGCHTGNALNDPAGSLTIASPTLTNWQYTLGQTYTINVTVAKTGATLFGLGFEALTSAGANAGTLTAGTGTKTLNATVSGNSRTNIVHNGTGNTGTGTHTFSFTWKAPATNVGNVTFYCAGNAANKNGTTSGDFIYTKSQVVTLTNVGIEEEPLTKQIITFPNPATDHIQVSFSGNKSGKMDVSVLDLKGALVIKKQTITSDDFIELNNLNAGSYLLHIEADGKVAVKKFIKQ